MNRYLATPILLLTGCLSSIEADLARADREREDRCFAAFEDGNMSAEGCAKFRPKYPAWKASKDRAAAEEREIEEERRAMAESARRAEDLRREEAQRHRELLEATARETYRGDPVGYCIWEAEQNYRECADDVRLAQRTAETRARTVHQQQVIATDAQTAMQDCAAKQSAALARCQNMRREQAPQQSDAAE